MARNVISLLIVGVSLMVVIVSAKQPRCGKNERWGLCGRICEGDCENNDSGCAATSCAGSGCQCAPGYVRDKEGSDSCILPSECPPKKSSTTPIACGENEQLGNCGQICEENCDGRDLSECAATSCSGSGCQCKPGYRRNNENNTCVLASECPKQKCKKNEVLEACGAQCEGTCAHPGRPEICKLIRCSTQGCQCDLSRGYVRTPQGDCVRNQDDKCCAAQLVCPANSEPRICGPACESTCANPEQIFCKLDPTNCTIDCHCKEGFVRNEMNGKCVKRHQCYSQQSDGSDTKDSDSKDSNSKDSDSDESISHDSHSKDCHSKKSDSKDSDSDESNSHDSHSKDSDESD